MEAVFAIVAPSGEIRWSVTVDRLDNLAAQAGMDHAIVAVPAELVSAGQIDSGRYMLDGQKFVERPRLAEDTYQIAADGLDEVEIAAPEGTIVIWAGEQFEADGSVSFATVHPGEHTVLLIPPFPHQRQTVRITASD